MTPTWFCHVCEDHGTGTWAQVDKAAEQHTKATRHATSTSTTGSIRVRSGDGAVRNVRAGGAG